MTYAPNGVLSLVFVFGFVALILVFSLFSARTSARGKRTLDAQGASRPLLRPIDGYSALPRATGEAVETGRRLHVSLGSGAAGGSETAAILAGLTVVEQMAQAASISDKPPVVTSGDGLATILAQNTLRRVYARQNLLERYDPNSARLAGATAFSFAAGAMLTVPDESVAANVLTGSFGPEIAAVADAGARAGVIQIAGAPDPAAQAVAYAGTDHPLIGEELFAAGAYLRRLSDSSRTHIGSLHAQDVVRLAIAAVIVILALAGAVGFVHIGAAP